VNLVLQGTPTFFDLLCVSHQERLFIRSGLETGWFYTLRILDGILFMDLDQVWIWIWMFKGFGSTLDLDLDVQGIWIEIGFGLVIRWDVGKWMVGFRVFSVDWTGFRG
jgi:hypothetical protein